VIDHTKAIEKAALAPEPQMLVDGELVAAEGDRRLSTADPSTAQELARIPVAGPADVDRAVAAARKAFDGPWRSFSPGKRARCLRKLAELISERKQELAMLESLDMGMPRSLSKRLGVDAVCKSLDYYASWTDKLYGEVVPMSRDDSFDYTVREPVGVIASIYPWNAPLLFVGSKLGPALATGNVVILKPSEQASLSSLRVAELVLAAGFPPGVVQVLTGDAETGRLLVEHHGVDKLSFTGGGETAKKILASSAPRLRPTILELGGKSPNIVFEDADLDVASMMASMGVFGLTGQACAAASRLLVQRTIYDEFVERVAGMAKGLPIGDPIEGFTMLGPLVSAGQLDRVQGYVAEGKETARLVLEIQPDAALRDSGGHFMGPVIFADVTPESRLWREEIFGPVLCVTPFDSEQEAVALANDTTYGLAAGIWTQSLKRAHRIAGRVRAGNVWVNTYGQLPASAPFGGVKQSGWGREGGRDALGEYTQVKNVMIGLT
jgi:acyl-CoA reductase-like NAD-dependent aldehyde dehydrogenase